MRVIRSLLEAALGFRMEGRTTRVVAFAKRPAWQDLLSLIIVVAALCMGAPLCGAAAERTLLPANRGPVIVVLDASGSMAAALGKETRLDAARRILLDTLSLFPADRQVGLVAYGHRRKSDCRDIETLQNLGPVDIPGIRAALSSLRAKGKTPLSGALRHGAQLLPQGGGTIMLVSDGLETCQEDPCAVAAALRKANAALVINVVGFGLAKGEMKGLACIAEQGGGRAIETSNANNLKQALETLTGPETTDGAVTDKSSAEPEQKPVDPPPVTPKPVLLRAMVGNNAVPGAILFTVIKAGGEIAYSGKGTEVTPSLVPGNYTVRLSSGNVQAEKALAVTGDVDEHHDIPLDASLVRLSLIAAKGLEIADTDIKGDPAWTLVPKDGQAPAVLDAVIAPETLLAPGRYEVLASIGEFRTSTAINAVAGKDVLGIADLKLGKITLEAGLPGVDAVIESGTGLSWTLASQAGIPDKTAEAIPRPTFLVPAGSYTARLAIAGAVMDMPVQAEAGATKVARLDLPSAELALEGSLGPGAPGFTDWRDATWTVKPVRLIGDAKAGAALEGKAEALPRLTLLPGEWDVTLISGQAQATRTLFLPPGVKIQERIELSAARLAISAAPDAGAPPPVNVLISIFAAQADGGFAEKPVVEVGTSRDYSLILPAGRYRIDAADEQGRKGTATLDLPQGQSLKTGIPLK